MRIYVYPYNQASASVRALRGALEGCRVIRRENSRFKGSEDKTVINWGNSKLPEEVMKCKVINQPEAVDLVSNKKTFFNHVKGYVSIPEFSDDHEVAREWLQEGSKVVIREKLRGHSAEGLVLIESIPEFDNYSKEQARLFVKYIPKQDEYRIHVMNGEIIDQQRKAIRPGLERSQVNFQVRNHGNGFIFVRGGVEPPEEVLSEALTAVKVCDLDFGAVDVIWNNFRKKAYVLEINTAPGLTGTTLDNYTKAFNQVIEDGLGEQVPLDIDPFEIFDAKYQPQPQI